MTNAEKILTYARKHIGKPYKLGARGPDAWDCSGLTKMAVAQIGYNFYHGASTQYKRGFETGPASTHGYWSAHGTIETLPMDRLAILFNRDKSDPNSMRMAHTGIYDGAGMVVQAGGQYPGVSDKPLNKNRWSHWATLKGVDGIMGGIGFGASGDGVKAIQNILIDLGYSIGKWGADGKFGAATQQAVVNFQTDNALPVTGIWSDTDTAKADEIAKSINDFPPSVQRRKEIIEEIKALLVELGGLG